MNRTIVLAVMLLVGISFLPDNRQYLPRYPQSQHPAYQRGYQRYYGPPANQPRLPWWWNSIR